MLDFYCLPLSYITGRYKSISYLFYIQKALESSSQKVAEERVGRSLSFWISEGGAITWKVELASAENCSVFTTSLTSCRWSRKLSAS